MKNAVKKIISAIIFWVIFGCLVIGVGLFVRPYDGSADCWHYFYKEEKNSLDMVMIGSSAVYRFWIPAQCYDEQGFTSFMIAQSNQVIEAIPYIMEEVVKTQNPDIFVVETRQAINNRADKYEGRFNQEEITHYFRFVTSGMHPSKLRSDLINDLLVEDEHNTKFEWQIPILKNHDNILTMEPWQIRRRLTDLGTHKLKGARQVPRVKAMKDPGQLDPDLYELTQEDKENIDRIAAKAEELGKKVVFVSMPYITTQYRYPLQVQLDEYIRSKGYDYIDLQSIQREEIGIDFDVDYYQENHVNISGAKKITSYLGNILANEYDIKSDLTPSQKENWDNALENWKKEEQKLMNKWEKNCQEMAAGN